MDTITHSQRLFLARLAIGLTQGLALYLLYRAVDAKLWPATQGVVFAPLLLVLLAAPVGLSLSLDVMPLRRALLWVVVASSVLALLGFFDNWMAWPLEWGYGSGSNPTPHIFPSPQMFVAGGAGLFIAHALVVGAITDRQLRAHYSTHFDVAWKMAVQLALSAAFVLAFWLLLWLGAGLFNLIKLNFFQKLLQHEWFDIPVICMAAGGAIHLTDIRPAMVRGARTLALTLLSWLLPMITLIVTGFLASLPFTGLSALWSIGHASALLLGTAAVLVILINASYQDGDAERLPPKLLQWAASLAALLPLPLALIAAYALHLRVNQYGWTADRVWLAASVCLACGYAGGYAYAAIKREPWLTHIERWNFIMSLCALVLIVALFTPIASPARIAVADQVARLNSGKIPPSKFDFQFLRWEGGRYGKNALTVLAASKDAAVRRLAGAALRETNKYGGLNPASPAFLDRVTVYPRGQALPQSFARMDWNKEGRIWMRPNCPAAGSCDAILADLDDDGRPEVLMASTPNFLQVFHETPDAIWSPAGTIALPPGCPGVMDALRQGHFSVSPPARRWNDIQLGGMRLHLNETDIDKGSPKCPS